MQLFGRFAIEGSSHRPHGFLGGCYLHIAHALVLPVGHLLAEYSLGALRHSLVDILMTIGLCATNGHKEVVVFHLAGVYLHTLYLHFDIPFNEDGLHIIE